MPTTNRPFFYNFLAAFRAHSALKASPTTSPGPASATAALNTQAATPSNTPSSTLTQSISSTSNSSSTPPTSPTSTAPRAISGSNPHKTPASLVSAFSPPAHNHTHQHTSHHHHTRHPSNNPMSRSPAAGGTLGNYGHRRSSDSSSDGSFRDALGGEKWFIGGRTAQGEERFYKLGMVRRDRSGDRSSLDRMSL